MYSLASRDLPYEFEVWPGFTPTAWFYLVSTHPGLLLSLGNTPTIIPYLQIPQGASQRVNELEGRILAGQHDASLASTRMARSRAWRLRMC